MNLTHAIRGVIRTDSYGPERLARLQYGGITEVSRLKFSAKTYHRADDEVRPVVRCG